MKKLPWSELDLPKIRLETRKKFLMAACEDFKVFCQLCGPPEWAFGVDRSVHDMIADTMVVEDRASDGRIRIHIEAPRGAGKSALGQRHAAWRLARSAVNYAKEPYRNGSISITYMCEDGDKADKAGKYVHGILSGKNNVTKVFGKLVDSKSAISEFTLIDRKSPRPDPSWATGTPNKSTTGSHPDMLYVDDVETPKSTRNLPAMMKTRMWYDELQAQVNPKGEVRVLGTRYDENDLYGYILDQPRELWTVMVAHVENAYCPTLPPEVLAGLKATMTPRDYARKYMNDPWPSEHQTFKQDMFQMRHYDEYVDALPKYMLVDIAGSTAETACETAIWIVAKDCIDNAFCIDCMHGRWDAVEVLERIRDLFLKRSPRWYVIEKRVLTTWVQPMIDKAAAEYRMQMPVRRASLKGYVDKDHHIEGLIGRFKQKKIWFCDSIPQSEIRMRQIGEKTIIEGPLVNAFTRWPKAKLKDVADALAYIDEYDDNDVPLVPKPKEHEVGKSWREEKTVSPWRQGRFTTGGKWKYAR